MTRAGSRPRWRARRMAWLAACGIVAAPAQARAQQVPAAGAPAQEVEAAMEPGLVPVLGALVPGLAVHGSGHFLGGDARAGRRLALAEGLGLATAALGAAPLALGGASRRVSYTLPLAIAGGGVFLLGWIADVYGAAGGPRLAGAPRRTLPGVEARLSYLYVRDRRFAYASFVAAAVLVRSGPWHVEAATALAAGDDNQRVSLRGGHRFLGPRPGRRAADGSALDLIAAVTRHRYGSDGFTAITTEAAARARLDLARVSPSLDGAFTEMTLGLSVDVAAYEHGAADVALLLVHRFGFGVYLGQPASAHGELQVFYDHRRDGLVGGLPTRRFNGILGSFGVDGSAALDSRLGLVFQAQAGSAYLLGLGLRYTRP